MRPGRLRVLVFIRGLGRGGAERLISEGCRFWDTESFDYRVAYQLPWKNQLVDEIESLGFETVCVGRGISSIPRFRALARWADLVHAHLPSTGVVGRIASPKPVVYTEHNVASSYRPLVRALNRNTYGRNRAVIAVSDAVAASVAGYPGPPALVIPNGVSLNPPEQTQVQEVRRELGIDASAPMIVHVGNIRPHKGHENLTQAAVHLAHLQPDAHIISVGGEKHEGDLERVRASADAAGVASRLRFVGSRSDAPTLMAAADIVVNPSDFEGLPVALLEAMALGRPVVATDVGGVASIVEHERTGLLVAPRQPGELANAIDRLIREPETANRLGGSARDLVGREYSLETMVQRTEDVYRRTIHA